MRCVFFRRPLAARVAVLLAGLSVVGCGGHSPATQSGSVFILTQPPNQIVPIGRTATFTVVAVGPALTYQWTKNGVPIPGATVSSYTTPTVSLTDNGTQYQVTVSSESVSETSAVATLTAGPRAPAVGDVRYLLWQQAGSRNDNAPIGVGQLGAVEGYITDALESPLQIGPQSTGLVCVWNYNYLVVPTSMDGQFTAYYQMGSSPQSWQSYLESLNQPNIVIISADLEYTTCYAIGVAYMQVQAGGFDYKLEEVVPSEVGATIAADGSASRIVTAVTYDSTANEWVLISYGWQGDRTTAYESQAVSVAPDSSNLGSAAQTLASEGYFISAFGGNNTGGYLLVGMRVQGDAMPRPLSLGSGNVISSAIPDNAFWTPVVYQGGFIAEQ